MTDTEKAALCARIDELCAELSRTQLNRDMWLIRAKVTLNSLSAAQAENARLCDENARLREFASEAFSMAFNFYHGAGTAEDLRELTVEYRELGIEDEQ